MNKTFIWIGGIVVVIILLMLWGKNSSSIEPPFVLGVVHPQDNIKGNASSSVVVMEYSDFECPACRAYYPIMREIMTEFKDQATFVYRHFPLISIHPNAEFAAQASEAARKQGKFWEMHDLLFEKQEEWSDEVNVKPMFESYAKLLGISVEQFKSDMASPEVKNFVAAQRVHAVKSGLRGTPTFFVNGKQIENPNSFDQFKSIMREAISSQL